MSELLTTTSLTPRFPTYVDSTMLVTFKACHRKFYNEYIICRSPVAVSPDLHAGGAFAAGMEATRRAFWQDKLSAEDAVAKGVETLAKYWGDYEPPESNPKTFERTSAALLDYFDNYPFVTDPIQPLITADGKPAIEFTFAIPIPVLHPITHEEIVFCGRFDLLGYYNEALFVIDEKTMKAMGSKWKHAYAMRSQFMGYTWASRQSGYDVLGAIVRGVCIQKTQIKHGQAFCPYPKWQIERWYEEMVHSVNLMVDCWKFGNWSYDYGDSCSSYGGCMFLGPCTTENEELWLEQDFKHRVWNPLEKDPTWQKELENV